MNTTSPRTLVPPLALLPMLLLAGCSGSAPVASPTAALAAEGAPPSAQLPTLPTNIPHEEITVIALSHALTVTPVLLETALPASPTNPASASVTAVSRQWTIYQSPEGGYSVPIRADWLVNDATQGRGLLIEFKDPASQIGGDDSTVRGGIDMPSRSPNNADLSAGLPDNHKEILFEQNITTAAGRGKIFTLKRDSPPAQNLIWFEQHAIIPTNDTFYDLWLKIPEPANGDPTPELAHMLAGFRLMNTR
jgi:hypothetical protein